MSEDVGFFFVGGGEILKGFIREGYGMWWLNFGECVLVGVWR